MLDFMGQQASLLRLVDHIRKILTFLTIFCFSARVSPSVGVSGERLSVGSRRADVGVDVKRSCRFQATRLNQDEETGCL